MEIMTNAEIKSYREYLGLTVHDLARLANTTHQKISVWESTGADHAVVPENVVKSLWQLDTLANTFVSETVAAINAHIQVSSPVILYRFKTDNELWEHIPELKNLPIAFHMVCVFRIKNILERDNPGLKVRIDYATGKKTNNLFSLTQE